MKKIILISYISLFSTLAKAQNSSINDQLPIKSISLFKDGSSFVIRNGKVKTTDKSFKIVDKDIPQALFGTLWINGSNNEISEIRAYADSSVKQTTASTISDMVQANKGKLAKITLKIKGQQANAVVHEGTIEEIQIPTNDENQLHIYEQNFLVLLKTKTNWINLYTSDIDYIEFIDKPNITFRSKSKTAIPTLSIGFNSNKSEQLVDMCYLQKGIQWTPIYHLEYTSDNKAKLVLRAEVINYAEDIKSNNINFVVGVPNFKYATSLSGLINMLGHVYQQARLEYDANNFSNAMPVQARGNYAMEEAAAGGITTQPMDLGADGSSVEDLFFYNLKDFFLKKGERAHYQLFSADLDIKHIYETHLGSNGATNNYGQDFNFDPNNLPKVYHSLKINNTSPQPWTTGAILLTKKDDSGTVQPISQDLLQYTAQKNMAFIKITEAPDVKIKQAEKEISRQEFYTVDYSTR